MPLSSTHKRTQGLRRSAHTYNLGHRCLSDRYNLPVVLELVSTAIP
ncbi:MAG: hypothetical protein KME52_09130 [Desmonostoc geniculatum HA4340-LM1]|nr:hypothetical protein [Desmonostoc geniculatum HA4340-LM1]